MDIVTGTFSLSEVGIGHWQDSAPRTGCTAILLETMVTAGLSWRGSAPATRELDLLHIDGITESINGVMLTGGSVFGLDSAAGAVRFLRERGRGFDAGVTRVPLLPTLSLFDLSVGDAEAYPDADAGYLACQNLAYGEKIERGAVGAGCGATIHKLWGQENARPSGFGLCSAQIAGVRIATAAVSNALGTLRDRDGAWLYGDPFSAEAACDTFADLGSGGNCTFAVVCVEALLNRKQAEKVAEMAMAGLARAITPAHTSFDFDAVIALSTGTVKVPITQLGLAAAETVHEAILDGARQAQ